MHVPTEMLSGAGDFWCLVGKNAQQVLHLLYAEAVRLQALLDHCSVNDPVILVMPWASSGCSGAGLGYSEQARAAHGGSDVEITHAPTFPSCDAMPSFRPYQKGASVDAGRTMREKAPFTPGVDAPRVQTSRRDA